MKAIRVKRKAVGVRARGTEIPPPNYKNDTSNSPLMGLDKSRPDSHHGTGGEAM